MTKWEIKRGDIIMCDLGKREGSVQSGIRPCVVVSNNYGNKYSSVYIVVPLTTKHKTEIPTHVEVAENSLALCEQITTVSEQQVLRVKEPVSQEVINNIEQALIVALDLDL